MQTVEAMLGDELLQAVNPAVANMGTVLRQRFGPSCVAILFYGSCLRMGEAMLSKPDSMLDFYLLVDDYRRAYPDRPLLARANSWLAPNVFYVEVEDGSRTVRAKYAVISVDEFVHACGYDAPTSAIWARFAQPARLVFASDAQVGARIVSACAEAVRTFVSAAATLQGEQFKLDALWVTGFRYSYDAELRSEKGGDRAVAIVAANAARYSRLGAAALTEMAARSADGTYVNPLSPKSRRQGQRRWERWRRKGKWLNLLRLIKAVFTFDGAVDYALWKVERHAGVRPHVSNWERRHPILAAPVLLWRFYRAGAFR